jgi:hypothetical protein
MAQITKVNGTTQPVFAIDVQNGTIANTANVAAGGPVQMAGPHLDFFSLTANSSLGASGVANATGYLNNVLQSIQQNGTIAMYQVTPSAPTVLNIAIYPTGAYTTATLVAAAQTANATGGLNIGIPTANVAGAATFTNV